MKYTFPVDCGNFGTKVAETYFASEQWKRLNYCKAAYCSESYCDENNGVTTKYTLLVSYASPVLLIVEHKGFFQVFFNAETIRCSSSTIQQVSRFLNYYFDGLVTYHDLKHAIERINKNHVFSVYHPLMICSFVECKDDDEILARASVGMKYCNYFTSRFVD